jgi:hypothetical protein
MLRDHLDADRDAWHGRNLPATPAVDAGLNRARHC